MNSSWINVSNQECSYDTLFKEMSIKLIRIVAIKVYNACASSMRSKENYGI